MINIRLSRIFILLLIIAILTCCSTINFNAPKTSSETITDVEDTQLYKDVSQWVDTHNDLSGFYPLYNGMDALGVRLRLAEIAEKSLDLQYFLMKKDTAGTVMMDALLKAADRGVRIRFLLDDVFTTASDRSLLLLNQHPNIEVRIFNPVSRHGFFSFNYLGDFKQANRRMHNKSFTVDNVVSVIGGRNIADEYFGLNAKSVFIDFDILAIGPIAPKISASFNEYWNHSRAVPMDQIAENRADETLQKVRPDIAKEIDGIYDSIYKKALKSQLLQDLIANRRPMFPAKARVMSDKPDKLINEISEENMQLANDLREVLLSAEKEIIFISPYYVPGDEGIQLLKNLAANGVHTIVLTNSLASNNHVSVHSAYARYRKDIINAGVELYEARANAAHELTGSENAPDALTMHTKVFMIDRRYLFVGSLNLDPRSIEINAEMGLLIDSEEMVSSWASKLEQELPTVAYQVLLNEDGDLEWHAIINGQEIVETKEPLTSAWLRFKAWFLKIAPEKQL
jgi:putative cardiolipin synthase